MRGMRRTTEKALGSEQTGSGNKKRLRIKSHGQWNGKDKIVSSVYRM